MKEGKRKVMVSYERLPEAIRNELKKRYPDGFQQHLICLTDHRNNTIHVLPHETAENSYLIKFENYRAHIANLLGNFKDFSEMPDESDSTID